MGKYSIAVDLGQSKVVAMAGCRREDGLLEIVAIAERRSEGLRGGGIDNIAQVNASLSGVIADLEGQLGEKIDGAYGGISGESVRLAHHSETVIIKEPSGGVSTSDVGELHRLMHDVIAPPMDRIIELSAQSYVGDGRREVREPIGTFCRSLTSTYNFTLCDKEAVKRLSLAFMQAGIGLKRCFANGVVASEAVLTEDERDLGCMLVDLGEGVTNVAIYHRGTLRYIASIPLGGSAIDRDLRSLMIYERDPGCVKIDYGCAVARQASDGYVTIEGRTPRERHNISLYNIAVAIEERFSDITDFIQREIRDSGFEGRLPCGVVLTGGGAKTQYIDMLFQHNLGLDVRIAHPEEGIAKESLSMVDDPAYATVVGILKRAVELEQKSGGVAVATEEEQTEEEQTEESTEEEATISSEVADESQEPPVVDEIPRREKSRVEASQQELDLKGEDDDEDDEDDEDDDEDVDSPQSKEEGLSMKRLFKSVGRRLNDFFTKNDKDDSF